MKKFYTNPISFTSQFTHCAIPFRLDSYKGCYFNCKYCFTKTINGLSYKNSVIPTKIKILEDIFKKAYSEHSNDINSVEIDALKKRVPVHFGGMSDPFQPIELQNRISLKILKLLKEYEYPVVISTKSILPKRDEYLKLISDLSHISFQVSISPLKNSISKKVEEVSPPQKERLNLIKLYSNMGIHTTCRLQPIFYNLIEENIEQILKNLADIGCKHIITEGYKHYTFNKYKIKKDLDLALNMEIEKEIKNLGGNFKGPYMEYPSLYKLKKIIKIAKMIRGEGMTFGSGDNDIRHIGDSPCCCGVADLNGFKNWFKYQFSVALFRRDSNNFINFSSIKNEWYPKGSISSIINSNSIERTKNRNSIKSIIKNKWNNTNDPSSLTRFWNVYPFKNDKNGMIIYKFKGDFNYFK